MVASNAVVIFGKGLLWLPLAIAVAFWLTKSISKVRIKKNKKKIKSGHVAGRQPLKRKVTVRKIVKKNDLFIIF